MKKLLKHHWANLSKPELFVEEPPIGKPIEIGWYDQFGNFQHHIAVRLANDTYHSSTGEALAKPDWWKEITAPPPNI